MPKRTKEGLALRTAVVAIAIERVRTAEGDELVAGPQQALRILDLHPRGRLAVDGARTIVDDPDRYSVHGPQSDSETLT